MKQAQKWDGRMELNLRPSPGEEYLSLFSGSDIHCARQLTPFYFQGERDRALARKKHQ